MEISIQTLGGRITAGELGFCQFHEHILLRKGQSFLINPALCLDDEEKSLEELRRFSRAGGRSLADAQPVGCGRMAREERRIALEAGVNIIGSTGFHKMIFYPQGHWIFDITAGKAAELFERELTLGMAEDGDDAPPADFTDIRAGIIKTALDTCGLTPQYKKLFEAAAIAQKNTGVPLMIHIEKGADAIELFDFFAKRGVDPGKLAFAHLDRACADIGVHKELCRRGAYVEYDTIGRFKYHSDEAEADIFCSMIDAGYEDKLLFSLDTTAGRLKTYDPNAVGLDYILTSFAALLKKAGATEAQLGKISHDNCAAIFA